MSFDGTGGRGPSLQDLFGLLRGRQPSGFDPNDDLIAQAQADIARRARLPKTGGLFGGGYARFMADNAPPEPLANASGWSDIAYPALNSPTYRTGGFGGDDNAQSGAAAAPSFLSAGHPGAGLASTSSQDAAVPGVPGGVELQTSAVEALAPRLDPGEFLSPPRLDASVQQIPSPPPQATPSGQVWVTNAETGKPYNDAQEAAYRRLLASGKLDPAATPGSPAFPRGMSAGGQAAPGEWYVDLDGSVRQASFGKVASDGIRTLAADAVLQAMPVGQILQMLRTGANLARSYPPQTIANAVDAPSTAQQAASPGAATSNAVPVRQSDVPEVEAKQVADLRAILTEAEGYNDRVYRDSVHHLPTVGIGHLVTPSDGLKVGDQIRAERINELFAQDSASALRAARAQAAEAGITDPDFIAPLASVNFQLGNGWNKEHTKTWGLIRQGDYAAAADEAARSDWYKQTPRRVSTFQKALRALAPRTPKR